MCVYTSCPIFSCIHCVIICNIVLICVNFEIWWPQDGKTPLHVACVTGDFEMVQILVEKGADLAAQDTVSYLLYYFLWVYSICFLYFL